MVTQGQGNIQLYAQGMLLGQSRIMTTFGGQSRPGPRTATSTPGAAPRPRCCTRRRAPGHDAFGNVMSPTVPSTGAGIGTLAPIPEVPAGDVDLIAPLGIDAGEAGIRVSGNVNIAALHVVNAANIQVQGESKGIPVTASVNTGAVQRQRGGPPRPRRRRRTTIQRDAPPRQNLPSIISVQILGYGDEQLPAAARRPAQRRRRQAGADLSGRQRVPDGRRRSADAGAAGRADAGRAAQLAAVTMAAITRPARRKSGGRRRGRADGAAAFHRQPL